MQLNDSGKVLTQRGSIGLVGYLFCSRRHVSMQLLKRLEVTG